MIIAELKGKLPSEFEGKEDILTSNVFGTLKNIDRQQGLKKFLTKLDIEISKDEAEEAEFLFWEKFDDRTEPDLIIDTKPNANGGCLILLEAKYFSPLGRDVTQLAREYKNGSKMARKKEKQFYLACITRDFAEPKEAISEAERRINSEFGVKLEDIKIRWVNWQGIFSLLTQIIHDRGLDLVSKRQIGDIVELLKFKGLYYFTGFKEEEIVRLGEALKIIENLAHDVYVLAGNLNGELKNYSILRWMDKENRIERDGMSQKLLDCSDWTTSYYVLPYYKKDWWDELGLYDAILFVKVFLDPFGVWVGCTLEKERTDVHLNRDYYYDVFDINQFVSYIDDELEKTEILNGFVGIRSEEVKALNVKRFGNRIVVYDKINLKELTNDKSLREIVEHLRKFASMVPEISNYLKESRQVGQ